MYIPAPQYMSLEDWVEAVMYVMIAYSNLDSMQDDDWQGWGMNFQQDPYLSSLNPPDPYLFSDWRTYGDHLALALEGAPDAPPYVGGPSTGPGSGSGKYLIAQNSAFIITQSGNFIKTQS